MAEPIPPEDLLTEEPRYLLSLDGFWEFAFEGPTARLEGQGHRARSPAIWQTQFPQLRNAPGVGRYQRRVDVPAHWRGRRIVLVLEGVFHRARVFVDGREVGTHANAWTTFELDLTDAVSDAAGFLLRVDAEVPDDRDYESESFGQILAGKQDWYGIHGGLWKPARLEARAASHLNRLAIQTSTDLHTHELRVAGELSAAGERRIHIALMRGGTLVGATDHAVAPGAFALSLQIGRVDLWSPDSPNLYHAVVSVWDGESLMDQLQREVGFRRFEARDGRLWLNGAPFYMFGALDQDWYPEEDCRSPSEAFLEQRFRNVKAMGLNVLRCHVKIPDRLYFELADRLGLIVWLDMPYSEFLAPITRQRLRETFESSVASHGHHPSVCVWTLFNEGWGIDLDDNPDDRRWLIETFDFAKARVPTSLVVDNSPCFPRNYHLKTDIEDFHWYNAFPLQNADFAATAKAFADRAAWAWSPHGDAVRTGEEPLICSEFGVWGLPRRAEILEADGSEPWWFESGHDWNGGAAYPHGMETRFRDAQLSPIFGDLDGFVEAAQETQYRGLKHQIETLRWAAPISGYVITELNDVQWECNGLMDVRNHPRRFADRLANLQQPWLIIARTERTAIPAGSRFEATIRLAGVGTVPDGGYLRWVFGSSSGRLPLSESLVSLALTTASSGATRIENLDLAAYDAGGGLLSQNQLEICVVAEMADEAPSLFALDARSEELLRALMWPRRAKSVAEADVLIATRLTTPVRAQLLTGRKTLLIANADDALVDPERKLPLSDSHNFPTMDLRPREGASWDGRWMGAFSWRRTDGPWSHLPNGPMLDEHWIGLLPRHVLTGFRSTAFGGFVDAGVAVAWLHKAAAFAKRSFLGKGWINVTTFDLTSDEAWRNPLAAHLLLALARG
jgi:hypothetical protein